jgi:hypothetical protein
MPVSSTDAIALKHDIDYIIAAGNSEMATKFDNDAIEQAGNSLEAIALKVGLTTRQWLGLDFAKTKLGDYTYPQQQFREMGQKLKQQVKNNVKFVRKFQELRVDIDSW